VTHRYTLLVGGTVISGREEPDVSAIAWADDTVLALGSDADIRRISRGDSHVVDLAGAFVLPLGDGHGASLPAVATLAVGGPANLAIVAKDPRRARADVDGELSPVAVVRAGRVVAGALPGGDVGHRRRIRPAKPTSLALIILAVRDLERALAFYRTAFGWPAETETPAYVEFRLPAGMRLGLYQREAFARNVGEALASIPPGMLASTELYLYPDDLEAGIDRLIAAGARPLSSIALRDWGDEVAYFEDPDGTVIALARAATVD